MLSHVLSCEDTFLVMFGELEKGNPFTQKNTPSPLVLDTRPNLYVVSYREDFTLVVVGVCL